MGGNGGDGFVPVLHLDSVQLDIHHVAIGAELGHFYPVTHRNHIVGGKLYARYQGQDGVSEDQ